MNPKHFALTAAALTAALAFSACGSSGDATSSVPVASAAPTNTPAKAPAGKPQAAVQLDAIAKQRKQQADRDRAHAKSSKQTALAATAVTRWLTGRDVSDMDDASLAKALSQQAGLPVRSGAPGDTRPGQGTVSSSGDTVTVTLVSTGKLRRTVIVSAGKVSYGKPTAPPTVKPSRTADQQVRMPAKVARQQAFEKKMRDTKAIPADKLKQARELSAEQPSPAG